ncbi:starvation-inducible DNA-binding protein [Mariniphaga anaerophila]|uniref:Starvation-inducible DNA-binding protein n=1 Tax=Mariniphaga anaerophila TaxID=1484053 RepID=A0A1M4W3D3_9BACT|nr:Dps family protein [Mariniphaga anaerophila]SHE75804.1 starvation-inducible DNA-binding protein [Mariniphaga anaerophila]
MKTNNSQLAERLNVLLSDYQIFYQNLRNMHWNVKGSQFFMLHEKYEELYNEAAATVDEIAERILMIGGKPLHTFADYLKTAGLKEAGYVSDGKEGIELVLENSRYLLKSFKEILELAEGDEGTSALMSDLIGSTEKRIWMLGSCLG